MKFEGVDGTLCAKVMSDVEAAFSGAMRERIGQQPADAIWFFDVLSAEETRVAIGEREKMRQALIQDRRITADDGHDRSLRGRAPDGFAWVVIDWGEFVSTMLLAPAAKDRWREATP